MKSRNPGFQPGNYWVMCDRCGFDFRVRETRKTCDNLLVCKKCWEPRHPQEYVKGKFDKVAVPIARPETTETLYTTTLNGAILKGVKTITVDSVAHIEEDDSVGVYLLDETTQWFLVTDVTGSDVTLNEGLNYNAADGALVTTSNS